MKKILLFALITLMFACSNEPKSKRLESCTQPTDCESGLTCQKQTCVEDKRTGRSCKDIENELSKLVDENKDKECSSFSDCRVLYGLCNTSSTALEKGAAIHQSIKTKADALREEWTNNNCEQDKSCDSLTTGTQTCLNQKCVMQEDECTSNLDCVNNKGDGYQCTVAPNGAKVCTEKS